MSFEQETETSSFRWRIVLTAGMGFFTDAYELFIIGVITTILAPIWHLSILQVAILNGAALASAAFGAVFFGFISDKFGRKKFYGIEVLILFFGAIFGACSQSFEWLLIARIIVGLGIGGDYPSSAVVASEHSSRHRRGYLVLLVFAMQAVGLIVGPLLASLFLASQVPMHIVWRVLLGVGAIPAASVFYLRRRIQESPHFLRSKKEMPREVSRVMYDLTDSNGSSEPKYTKQSLWSSKWLKYLIGTAGAWFLLDVAFYGNGISAVMIIDHLNPHADLLSHTIISAMIFLVFAVPGYFLAAKNVDRIGRKPLQILGFLMIAVSYCLIAFVPAVRDVLPLFIIVFGVSFFFVNFGPNTTTFLIPSEIYPTSIRGKAHGISAAVGKLGAFVGAFTLPLVLKAQGLSFVMASMAGICILGILVTFLLPEMKNKELSDVETVEQVQLDLK